MSSLILNLDGIWYSAIFRCTTLNHLRVNIKHFLGPILGAEVAQKRAPFPAVVTRTEMGNANICILLGNYIRVDYSYTLRLFPLKSAPQSVSRSYQAENHFDVRCFPHQEWQIVGRVSRCAGRGPLRHWSLIAFRCPFLSGRNTRQVLRAWLPFQRTNVLPFCKIAAYDHASTP